MRTGFLALIALVAGVAAGQTPKRMDVSVYFDGASDGAKKAVERYIADGIASRGIRGINDNRLDKDPDFDDYAWVVIKSVDDPESGSFAWDVQFSIVEGVSVNYMLYRFRGSLTEAAVAGSRDAALYSTLNKLMDLARREFDSVAYRRGWHPVPLPHGTR